MSNLLEAKGFMEVDTLDNALKVSNIISKSNFCPNQLKEKPGDILIALQMGAELGLKPMQALQNIAVINGRPSLWGDAMLAVCRQHPDFEYIKEDVDEREMLATCRVKRKSEPEFLTTFSMKDAERAGLISKGGPWKQYPKRMLQMRARGFCLRDSFPDTLRGIISREEAEDYPNVKRVDYSKVGNIVEGTTVANEPCISEEQVMILGQKIAESESEPTKFCEAMKIQALMDMRESQFDEAVRLLNRKIAKKRKANEVIENQIIEVETEELRKVE